MMGFVDECVGNEVAQRVFFEDVYVDVDMMLCLANVGQQFWEEGVAVGHNVDTRHLEGQREILVDEQVDELFVALGHVQVLLFDESQHRAFRQLVERALRDEAFTSVVDAKEQVEHDAHQREEEDDQCPRHGLGGLSVVHDDMNDGYGDDAP